MEPYSNFHKKLKTLLDRFVHKVYDVTTKFPKEEVFGLTSQYRRSSLSSILNYIEGYARQRKNVLKNFLEISYGSIKEAKYLTYFSYKRKYLSNKDYLKLIELAEEIGKMVWSVISHIT